MTIAGLGACQKKPARGARGMVCTNHPLASAAGAEVLSAGGNAVDAAIAALFSLTVVEPMMVGLLGGGVAHLRMADGRHSVIDGLSRAPAAATPDMYALDKAGEVLGRANVYGALAVAVPAALPAWCHALEAYGTWSLDDVMQPAIRLAERGFLATSYLSDAIADAAADLAQDADLAARFLPGGTRIAAGQRLVQADYGATLREVAAKGAAAWEGPLGQAITAACGLVSAADLAEAVPLERMPIHGDYRGFDVFGPPPPASSGVHVAQMLNILEGFDVASLGFGSARSVHLLAEVLKIAFADRAVATADPAFVDVPVDRLIAKSFAASRRAQIDMERAGVWTADPSLRESANTTHVTVADEAGNIVATTQTINSLFGARIAVPGTGLIANNYMLNFDPHPGRALSIEPGKRVFTSMAPMIVLRDQKPVFALGLPGGLRIFGSAMQAIVNLIDHRMPLQEAVESPRVWTMGGELEIEPAIEPVEDLAALGHDVKRVKTIGGGMNAIAFDDDGAMTGAACWRADGCVVALGGGLARAGVRFSPDAPAT
ncbi:gamma-glutamyltransferase [Humitalea sp. 24SJ18S-53]|uniref:gamma-glutamyltransferase n=1 Tax=Humitalea sp. 24SJ18S-53 TaxID=3422307 RepID=UPI003D67B338